MDSNNNISYGFITRGCPKNCSFCIVSKKEGKIKFVNNPIDIIKHKHVRFLDNNILAYYDHRNILQELIDSNIKCEFYQGLDFNYINDKNANLLSKLNYYNEYIFAFDDISYLKAINKKMSIIKKYITKEWKIKFFIYCNPNQNIYINVVRRVNYCKQNKIIPYLIII